MTLVSNDPSWWPYINSFRFFSYCLVSASVVVIYDYVLTIGQEIELIWRQRWSLTTVLYLSIRYIGILYVIVNMLISLPSFLVTDSGCIVVNSAINWTNVVVNAMVGVIMIARLHTMYQGSRKMLIFLITVFLAVNVAYGVLGGLSLRYALVSGEELNLSGNYFCSVYYEDDILVVMYWTITAVWEVLALCLLVWIGAKHFRDSRQFGPSTRSTIGNYLTVLIKSHALYFASFAAVACLQLGSLSPSVSFSLSMGAQVYTGALQILTTVQIFVLGPRFILSVRECHAKHQSDARDARPHRRAKP